MREFNLQNKISMKSQASLHSQSRALLTPNKENHLKIPSRQDGCQTSCKNSANTSKLLAQESKRQTLSSQQSQNNAKSTCCPSTMSQPFISSRQSTASTHHIQNIIFGVSENEGRNQGNQNLKHCNVSRTLEQSRKSTQNIQVKQSRSKQDHKESLYERQTEWEKQRKLQLKTAMKNIEQCSKQNCKLKQSTYQSPMKQLQNFTNTKIQSYDKEPSSTQKDRTQNTRKQESSVSNQGKQLSKFEESSQKLLQTHIRRYRIVPMKQLLQQQLSQLQPGSGKLWNNQLTVPSSPKLSGLSLASSKCGTQLQSPQQSRANSPQQVKSLKRPISPSSSSYLSPKKRHSNYPQTTSLDQKLENSNQKLKYYQEKVQHQQPSIVDDLESQGILYRSVSALSCYKASTALSIMSQQMPMNIDCKGTKCFVREHLNQVEEQKKVVEYQKTQMKMMKMTPQQEQAMDVKIMDLIHSHIQSIKF